MMAHTEVISGDPEGTDGSSISANESEVEDTDPATVCEGSVRYNFPLWGGWLPKSGIDRR